MDTYNKVEIQGILGYIHCIDYGSHTVAKISIYDDSMLPDDATITQRKWFVAIIDSRDTKENLLDLQKGDCVRITGSLHTVSYTDNKGDEKMFLEIAADNLKKISEK